MVRMWIGERLNIKQKMVIPTLADRGYFHTEFYFPYILFFAIDANSCFIILQNWRVVYKQVIVVIMHLYFVLCYSWSKETEHPIGQMSQTWWRHQMETFSA